MSELPGNPTLPPGARISVMNSETSLEVIAPAPSPGQMMQSMIDRGITSENVAAFKELVMLSEHMEDRGSVKRFAEAFVALQAEMQNVKAVRPVPNNDGTVRYRYAPFDEIMKEVGPRLKAHGFTVAFSTDYAEGRLIKICELTHVGGHSKSNKFAVRIGQGPPKSTETQADGAASTYAKRGALCDCLNIVIDHDDDARAEGGTVTAEQAQELEHRARMTNSNIPAFLKYAGASKFSEIPAAKYVILDEFLRIKERGKT